MCQTMSKPKVTKPVTCTISVIQEPIYPCELKPNGVPGIIEINGEPYTVEVIGHLPAEGHVVVEGYWLTREGSEPRDVCLRFGCLECDCPDFIFRRQYVDPQGCRHCIAVRRHLVQPLDQFRRQPLPAADDTDFDNP